MEGVDYKKERIENINIWNWGHLRKKENGICCNI
jgi:hypothetical protein